MREYSAISVSASDANSLADRLTEQSRGGWDLVKIIAADHNVVAYLSREADPSASGASGTHTPATTSGSTATSGSTSSDDSATSPTGYGTPIIVAESAVATDSGVSSDAAVGTVDNAGNAYVVEESRFEAADATPGWGSTSVSNPLTSADDQASQAASQASDAASQATSQISSATGTSDSSSADSSGGDAGSSSSSSGDSSGSAASGGLAPAGWYADPAERFDLRYWDGSQWTEHVARGGQQDTDPPQR